MTAAERNCMRRSRLRAWWCSRRRNSGAAKGFTLIELLVALSILAILAGVALPYAEVMVRREKELELRRSLREMRGAIDRFHDDWQQGLIAHSDQSGSEDGWPRKLEVLVQGVARSTAKQGKESYLRRVPDDPFAGHEITPEQQWGLRSYQDEPKAGTWGGQDVYDVFCKE